MIILAIETSCDETAVAITKNGSLLRSNIGSQITSHAEFGGVVPELAARMHIETIIPLVKKTIKEAGVAQKNISAIAVTYGPGLLPSLLVGVDTAKALAFAWNKPLIAVNHMEGHVISGIVSLKSKRNIFPLLCLTVSGGHTEIVRMKNYGNYTVVGKTIDDAAGEAFDKVATLLDLSYPGGPEIARLAHLGNSKAYQFAKPLMNNPGFDYSFSGLKTDVLRFIKKRKRALSLQEKRNVAASFQKTVVDILLSKYVKAAKKYTPKTCSLAGGVSANTLLRKEFEKTVTKELPNATIAIPSRKLSTDNAIMIAAVAEEKYTNKEFADFTLSAEPNLSL